MLVNLPSFANRRVHNRYPKILFKKLDNAHRLPATALNIDAVRIAMLTIKTLDVGVEHLDRNLRYLVERHVDRLHRQRPETGGSHIVQHNFVLQRRITRTDKLLDLHRAWRGDLHLWVGNDRRLEFLCPRLGQRGLFLRAEQHERRSTGQHNDINALFGEFHGEALILGDRIEEFGVAAGLKVQQQRHDAYAFWQDADQLFERARASGRPDHSDDTAPQRKAHV